MASGLAVGGDPAPFDLARELEALEQGERELEAFGLSFLGFLIALVVAAFLLTMAALYGGGLLLLSHA